MIISDNLSKILYKFNSDIYNYIRHNNSDINYIDISKTDPYKISYIHIMKINDLLKKYDNKNIVWEKNRNVSKPGRFLKKINKDLPQHVIESFSNFYKNEIRNIIVKNEFKIVKGKELLKYFHYTNYQSNSGTLSLSCMRYSESQKLLEFYSQNDINLLILVNVNTNKILGRALLWDTIDGYKIMDRVYTIDDSIVYSFFDWAKNNNYYRKKNNNWYDTINFISPDNKTIELKLSVNMKIDTQIYPYLDTFKWYNIKKHILYNYNDGISASDSYPFDIYISTRSREENIKLLMSTNGQYSYSHYLLFDDIYRIYRPYTNIVKCKYLNKSTYKKDTIYSILYHDNILIKDSKILIDDIIVFKDDNKNDIKLILKNILNKVKSLYYSDLLSNNQFKLYKNIFSEYEKKLKKKIVSL
jgi:hypothetical protein